MSARKSSVAAKDVIEATSSPIASVAVARPAAPNRPRARAMHAAAIGPYSQAVRVGQTVWLSGQIGLDPATGQLAEGFEAQAERVFDNLAAVVQAAGGSLSDVVKVNLYLTDLGKFDRVNALMASRFEQPYPARAAMGVASLPRGALIEAEAVMVLGGA